MILDIVPNHMAATRTRTRSGATAERARSSSTSTRRPAAYRRFFDVGDLAGVRVEDPEVFEATHAKVLELVRDGLVDGLRIDHPDGLADPRGYLERLRDAGVEHVWVEKILEPGEQLRDWPVEGTTGYEFANDVTALFVDPAREEPLTALYAELTGEGRTFEEIAHEAKLEQAATTFEPEVERLQRLVDVAASSTPRARLVPRLPHVRRARTRRGRRRRPRGRRAALPPTAARDPRCSRSAAHDEFVTRFQQTTRPGDGEGRRGHGVLPLRPAALR